jgi:ABC-type nickel/cobalt efflux system permease component RcnA
MNLGNLAPLGIALLGLFMGMRHATDPDHVVAVTTILSRERRLGAATRVGVIWGVGHTLTVLAVGIAIIVFKIAIPTRLGLAMEFAVAIVLILLGLSATVRLVRSGVRRMLRDPVPAAETSPVHSHFHSHSGASHWHPHVHDDSNDSGFHHAPGPVPINAQSLAMRRPLLRSFGVGLVHGLAGSAAIALLVLSAIPQPLWATIYLGIFCLGTIVGMGLITTAIATPLIVASRRLFWLHQGFVTGSGLLSFGFGLFLAYQIGIVDGLFSAVPIWTPH